MRVLLLTLLLAVCITEGLFNDFGDKLKKTFSNQTRVGEKLKITVKGVFDSAVIKISDKLSKLKEKVKKTLELTPRMLASLKERIAKLRRIKHVHVNEMGDSIEEVNEKSKVDDYLFQGDIILTEEQADEIEEDIRMETSGSKRFIRQASRKRYPATLWSDGVKYYFDFNTNAKIRSVFRKGVEVWEKNTCINFKEDSTAADRLRVFYGRGCSSYVGRIGGKQDVSLGKGCDSVATAMHELGHALGFFHTMARHDRDTYVTVNIYNIKPSVYDQFAKQTPQTNENYNITYDYGSIMHYGGRAGTSNGEYTLVPLDTNHQETLGSPFIAFYELLMMNTHYKCLDKCMNDPNAAICKMGGFPNPRDCSRCICPSGYGGRLCDERPSGCGQVLQATRDYQNLVSTIGNPNKKEQEDFEICNYWIESPAGTQIEVRIDKISGSFAVDGCRYFGVEIKTQKDQLATGYRFCAAEDADVTLLAHSNRVPIITFSREAQTNITIQYRFVTDGKPGPRPSTARPTLPPGYRCEDSAYCTQSICKSKVMSDENKMGMCPKLCGFC